MNINLDNDFILMLLILFVVFMLPNNNKCVEVNEYDKSKDVIYRSKKRKDKKEKRRLYCAD